MSQSNAEPNRWLSSAAFYQHFFCAAQSNWWLEPAWKTRTTQQLVCHPSDRKKHCWNATVCLSAWDDTNRWAPLHQQVNLHLKYAQHSWLCLQCTELWQAAHDIMGTPVAAAKASNGLLARLQSGNNLLLWHMKTVSDTSWPNTSVLCSCLLFFLGGW